MSILRSTNLALKKSKYIFQEEGAKIYFDRLLKIIAVKFKRQFIRDSENVQKWFNLKNIYQGERAFLIGNGPSLNVTPLHLLKDEYTICFNRFNIMFERLDWIPTMYCTIDDLVLLDMVEEINDFIHIFNHVFLPDLHPYNINFKSMFQNDTNVNWLYLDKLPFSLDLPYCGINKTVANVGLQILGYLGFSEIYLIGVDMDYKQPDSIKVKNKREWKSDEDDDPNHFDPRYFGKGRIYHHPRLIETFDKFSEGKEFFDDNNINIYNAGVGGKLEIFPRKKFRSIFNISLDQEREIFLTGISNKIKDKLKIDPKSNKIHQAFHNCTMLELKNDNNEEYIDKDVIIVDEHLAQMTIKKLIFRYIPYGPCDNQIIFIKRELLTN